jgi:hypothetical protein
MGSDSFQCMLVKNCIQKLNNQEQKEP